MADTYIPPSTAADARPPHEVRAECRECGAHARVLIAYGARTGYCSVCGSNHLQEIRADSGGGVVRRFRPRS